ncbi:hypothetical protein LTR37_010514 [Vermiconidia calcicola]|uniref:Uncharacterized protein n=1 Tax=Vermiconidia calcicola TaxID=1690605 RepID=A0ACC3N5F6_9PEZI|nr:hypothetical protein LTR37_010514 [Vermiconidia calcicola]
MLVDEAALAQKYDVIKFTVAGSTQLSSRTAAVVAKLKSPLPDSKPVLVALTAKARIASKLISVVEIAKREMAASKIGIYQYNALGSEMSEISPRPENKRVAQPNSDGESDDAFETMGAQNADRTTKKSAPLMTTYLSTTSIKEMRNAYGEQR